MPGIGSSLGGAAKAIGEAVVQPTADTFKTAATEGVVEPIIGTRPNPQNTQPPTQTASQTTTPPSNYNPQKRQNVVNFLNQMASAEKSAKAEQEMRAKTQAEEEEQIKKQTEIRQIEVKKASRNQMLNRAVYDKQRGTERKKGST